MHKIELLFVSLSIRKEREVVRRKVLVHSAEPSHRQEVNSSIRNAWRKRRVAGLSTRRKQDESTGSLL